MSETLKPPNCGKCGAALSGYAPAGLCAACLLECAFEIESPLTASRSPTGGEGGGSRDEREIPVLPPPTTQLPRPDEESPGSVIGRYKLLEKIGEGGFGVVYVAEQREPVKRRVALKIIKLGMDTRQVVARFEAERQALAMMDHANIAKVFDAGATDAGRPYFVMELVRGLKITDYCDQHNLPARERLNLFIQVCQALQHAHQKGIIHRDIKPSNVLVTVNDGVPVPKVIDFGIAKATQGELTDKTVYTQFQQFIGTPAYMSPEQAEMTSLDIDTRSDIYALGVLLYELLTGKTPFEQKDLLKAGLDGMRRMIREQEPLRPSTRVSSLHDDERTTTAKRRGLEAPKLVSLLRGDLDWIVMKCLEKDRTRRYETANGVAMDVHRYLNHEPVVAARPSALYTFQKFSRRHRAALATTTAFVFLLVVGIIVSVSQAVRATRAEKSVRTEASRSGAAFGFMSRMLEGVGPKVARGRDPALLLEILETTAKRVDTELQDQPLVEADLRMVLGKAYGELNMISNAVRMTQATVELRRKHLGLTNVGVADALANLAVFLSYTDELPRAEQVGREALAMRLVVHGRDHTNVAMSLNNLGNCLWYQGKLAEAEDLHRRALDLRRKLLPPDHLLIAMSLLNLANLQVSRGNFTEVDTNYASALQVYRNNQGDDSPDVASIRHNLTLFRGMRGDLPSAEAGHRETLEVRKRIYRDDHPYVAESLTWLGAIQTLRGNPAGAETNLNEAFAMQTRMEMGVVSQAADTLYSLGNFLLKQGRWAAALEKHQQALAMRTKLAGTNETADKVDSLDALGVVAFAQGNLEQARVQFAQALDSARKSQSGDYPAIIGPLWHLAWVAERNGDGATAASLRGEALTIAVKHKDYGAWPLFRSAYALTDVLQLQGRFVEAELLLNQVGDHALKNVAADSPLRPDTFQRLVNFYETWDRAAPNSGKALLSVEWRKKLEEFNQTTNEPKP